MEIVHALPEDLKYRVYSFGYPGLSGLRTELNHEIKWLMNSSALLSMFWKGYDERFILTWSNFCRCCERHRHNRGFKEHPSFKPPKNGCKCRCRHLARHCEFALTNR